ncbi:MAG: maleylpyruvate isomerase family mycothiol-dependent enzyme, partial [Dehalococcoidia bacterium]
MAKHDYEQLMWAESQDLATFLGELDDGEFDRDSLCDGWRVRDVMSHMIVGHTTPMPTMLRAIARYRGNVPKGSFELSRQFGSAHTPTEIRGAWSDVARDHTRRGITRVITSKEGFVDHLIHHQDIRRPLARPRAIPGERLTAALDALPTIGGFLGSKGRMKA